MGLDQKAPHPFLGWGAFLMEIKFNVSIVSVRLWPKILRLNILLKVRC